MNKSYTHDKGAILITKLLKQNDFEAYVVGGCVRDMMLENVPNDIDICTNASTDEVINICRENSLKYGTEGIKYGTIVIVADDTFYEVTSYRRETEYKGNRKPVVEFNEVTLEDDLSRRDFTFNAMAYDMDSEELVDIYNGKKDLEQGIIRAVGNPEERFEEDALRILRALRFSIRFDFEIETKTEEAMLKHKELLNNISKERITKELMLILTCGKEVAKKFMRYSSIITTIIPELQECVGFNQNNKYHKHDVYEHILCVVDGCKRNKFEIKLAALMHDIGKPSTYSEDNEGWGHFYGHSEKSYELAVDVVKDRLRLCNEQAELVTSLVKYHDMVLGDNVKQVKRVLNKQGIEWFKDWLVLKESDRYDHVNIKSWRYSADTDRLLEIAEQIVAEQQCFSLKMLDICGKDITSLLGIKPSKLVGDILNRLLNEVIDGELNNNKLDLTKRVVEINRSICHE